MAITYPLSIPSISHVRSTVWDPVTVVGIATSPFTGQSQTIVWPGQWWAVRFSLIQMKDPNAGLWESFLLSLNGQQGTFKFGDPSRKLSRGNPSGAWVVGSGAGANSTNLPISGGAGTFAVGDWLQIGNYLHRILKLVDAGNVDVFPRLRASYAAGTLITYANALGIFRLQTNDMSWSTDEGKIRGITIAAVEAL
jgi:hypothetical protein